MVKLNGSQSKTVSHESGRELGGGINNLEMHIRTDGGRQKS